jgi:SNF2 family DNA or RNA helicase
MTVLTLSLTKVLLKVFDLYGWKWLEYDGTMSQRARASAIDHFEKDEAIDILLISNVGTTGLNITRASVVVFVVSGSQTAAHIYESRALI